MFVVRVLFRDKILHLILKFAILAEMESLTLIVSELLVQLMTGRSFPNPFSITLSSFSIMK